MIGQYDMAMDLSVLGKGVINDIVEFRQENGHPEFTREQVATLTLAEALSDYL